MGSSSFSPLRGLPRAFVSGIPIELPDSIELPKEEFDKFHKVLRLSSGDEVALLTGDGRLIRGTLSGHNFIPATVSFPGTESLCELTLGLSFSKPESLENSVRMATELGVKSIVLFSTDRTVVKWDADKLSNKLARIKKIARESAELSFRTAIPEIRVEGSLKQFLEKFPAAIVLSETEGLSSKLENQIAKEMVIVVGPEGGWSPREVEMIGSRATTLGVRVLRVETAVAAAVASILGRFYP